MVGENKLSFFKIQIGATPSVYAHYLYDAGGNRVKKITWDQQENKEVTVYIDGVFEYRLKQEGGADKKQNIIHVMDDATRIAQKRIGTAFSDDITNDVHYVLDDHLGSSNARLDASGGIIDRQEYYPFGDTSLRTYSKKRYQFIGREKDAESGLHYWSARCYSSWTCRFISVDKMASSYAHLTPYNYADNDPINDFDIDGNQNGNTKQTTEDTGGSQSKMPTEENTAGVREVPDVHGEVGKNYRVATVDEAKSAMKNEEKPGFTNINGREYEYVYSKGLTKLNNVGGYFMVNPAFQKQQETKIVEGIQNT